MPYSNLPKSQWAAMDKCVADVQATGKDKQAAIAICYTSISKQQGDDEMSAAARSRQKREAKERGADLNDPNASWVKRAAKDRARKAREKSVITDLSELGQAFGWSEKDVKASYPWDSCIADQMKKYGSRTRAEKICGAIRANAGKALSDERIAMIINLSPVTAPNFRAKFNENHDSATGEFTSGGGGSGGIGPAMPKVRNQTHYHQMQNSITANLYSIKNSLESGRVAGKPMDDAMRARLEHQQTVLTRNLSELNKHAQARGFKEAADKGITDAPNLRGEDAQCCGNCQYYKELASGDSGMGMDMMQSEPPDDSGICTKFDFEADMDWVCDAWEAVAAPDVAAAIQDAAQAIADATDGMGAMGKEEKTREKFNPNHDSSTGEFASGGGGGGSSGGSGDGGSAPKHAVGFSSPREEITFVRHRLATGGLKRGEQQRLQKREEELARAILSAPDYTTPFSRVTKPGAMSLAGKEQASLAVFKQADGRLRVVGWASNNRRDKDNPPEIITEAAHKEFMSYLDAHPEHAPEFWHWHTPGTKYAKADWWDYADGFTVYSGLVDAGKEAQAEKAAAEGIGMSHGFHVLGYDNAQHHITQYRTFEVSDLPKSRAANPYTSFSTIRKEASMAFSEAKKAYLLERLPAETVAELERKTSDLKAAADAAGIEAKEVETPAEVATEVAAPVDEKADSKPTDKPAEVAADGGDAKPKSDTSASDMMQMMSDMMDKKLAAMGKEVGLAVGESIKSLVERVGAAEETAVKAQTAAEVAAATAQKSLDDMVAELISPAPLRKGYRASAAADTRVPAKKQDSDPVTPAAKAVEEPTLPGSPSDWWTKEVMKPAGLA